MELRKDYAATALRRLAARAKDAAPRRMLADLRQDFLRAALTRAVAQHDPPALFDWMMHILSYQGVSDAVAHCGVSLQVQAGLGSGIGISLANFRRV